MASCKFEGGKCKGPSDAKAHMRHNDISPERRVIACKKNKHIDPARSKYNFSILGLNYEECAAKYDARIAYLDNHGNKNKRKDRVTMQVIEIPVPADLPRNLYKQWFIRISEILRQKYGEENFIEGSIHYDEEHEYRDPETKEKHWSRVHGHFMIVPEVNGGLNAKQISLRKNMKALNREVDQMTKTEFGCAFMTGTKKKSVKSVEQLKQESEYAEMFYQLEQQKKEITELDKRLRFRQDALAKKLEDIEAKEKKLVELQDQVSERYRALEKREKKADSELKLLKEALRECECLRETYRHAAERLKGVPAEIPGEELTEQLSNGIKHILSGFTVRDGSTLWDRTGHSVMTSIKAVVGNIQGQMPGAILKEGAGPVRRGEASTAGAVRRLKDIGLPIDEGILKKWNAHHTDKGTEMGL